MIRIANSDGSVAEALDYATFGARRAVGNPAGSGTSSTNTPRGFTGHEYVDGTDVIHMNGRIYDAKLGRFLQADPLIQQMMEQFGAVVRHDTIEPVEAQAAAG